MLGRFPPAGSGHGRFPVAFLYLDRVERLTHVSHTYIKFTSHPR